jgi:hypothetical protein
LVRGWHHAFDDPIPLSDGCAPITPHDAATFIPKLPKAEHGASEWQAAIRALMLVVEHGGDTTLSRVGMMRALHPPGEPTLTRHKTRARKRRIMRRLDRPRNRDGHAVVLHNNISWNSQLCPWLCTPRVGRLLALTGTNA